MKDKKLEIDVKIGEMEVAKPPYKLKTLLGSCVALILYDRVNKIGGLAHIFLPEKRLKNNNDPDSKYANTAVPALLNRLLQEGAKKQYIMAYMVGGNKVYETKSREGISVADHNIEATKNAISKEGLLLLKCDVKRSGGVRVIFCPETGDLKVEDIK